ncbi:MAG: rane spanning protein ribonuclease BN-like family, partial [Deltaproteobacteria bacterium]|nr:rane spanning protein ribonuclease BN-like family [Deltaproteobacteria bacterium]
THHLIANFRAGDKALTAGEISNRLEIPIRFVNDMLSELLESNVLATAESEEGAEPAYQPALDPDRLTIQYVVEAMEKRGQNTMPFIHAPEFDALSDSLESFGRTIRQLPENILLKKL